MMKIRAMFSQHPNMFIAKSQSFLHSILLTLDKIFCTHYTVRHTFFLSRNNTISVQNPTSYWTDQIAIILGVTNFELANYRFWNAKSNLTATTMNRREKTSGFASGDFNGHSVCETKFWTLFCKPFLVLTRFLCQYQVSPFLSHHVFHSVELVLSNSSWSVVPATNFIVSFDGVMYEFSVNFEMF